MQAVAFAALLLAMTAAPAAAAAPLPLEEAKRWLALVDAAKYADSWSAAGTIFRQHLTGEAWTAQVEPVREPLGAVLSRTLLTETKARTLPGVPDGEYDVIQFSTDFAHKKAAVETVALTHQPDGWRVDGYFIK